jgi:hypothetical protein
VLRRVGDAHGITALRLSWDDQRVAEELRRFTPDNVAGEFGRMVRRPDRSRVIIWQARIAELEAQQQALADCVTARYQAQAATEAVYAAQGSEHLTAIDPVDEHHLHALAALHMTEAGSPRAGAYRVRTDATRAERARSGSGVLPAFVRDVRRAPARDAHAPRIRRGPPVSASSTRRAAVTAPSVRLRRVDAPALGPGVLIRVRHTLLPLYWLRGVPVLRDISHELNVFERLLLEMALELGSVSGKDITEVLDLQPEFLVRGAWRLAVAGALRLDGDLYRVVPDVAERLLRDRRLPQRVQSTADFVLLPRTGDLLAVASGQAGWLAEADRQRRKLRPHGAAPAPETLWSSKRAEYLAERVRAGDIAGSDHEIAEVVIPSGGDEALLPRLQKQRGRKKQSEAEYTDTNPPRGCPAYNCSAQVREGSYGLVVEAYLTGEAASSGPSDRDGSGPFDADSTDTGAGPFTLKAELTGAAKLVATWQAQLDALDSEPNIRTGWQQVADTQHDYEHAERTGVSTTRVEATSTHHRPRRQPPVDGAFPVRPARGRSLSS